MPRHLANRIYTAVICDLCDRGGFDSWWDNLDPETQQEIRETLIGVIAEELGMTSDEHFAARFRLPLDVSDARQ